MQWIQDLWMRAKTVFGLWKGVSGLLSWASGPIGWVMKLVGVVTQFSTPFSTVWSVLTSKVVWLVIGVVGFIALSAYGLITAEHHGADKVVTQTAVQQLNNIKKGAVIEKHNRALPASAARKRLFHDYGTK